MPVVRPEQVLQLGTPPIRPEQQLVVFDFGQVVGMAVDTIVDIVDAAIDKQPRRRHLSLTQGKWSSSARPPAVDS